MALNDILDTASATWQAKAIFGTKTDAVTRTDSEATDYAIAAWANEVDQALEHVNEASNGERDWGYIDAFFNGTVNVAVATAVFLPLVTTVGDSGTFDEYRSMIAPYDGYLVKAFMQCPDTDPGSTDMSLFVNAVQSGASQTDAAPGTAYADFTFGSGFSFTKGQRIALEFDPTNSPGDITYGVHLRFDTRT